MISKTIRKLIKIIKGYKRKFNYMNKKKKSIQQTQDRIRQKIINETEEEDIY